MKLNSSYSQETLNSDKNLWVHVPCDLAIRQMTLKNIGTPLLCYLKLCASFRSHRGIQTEITIQEPPSLAKLAILLCRVTLKFDGWPWKTLWHLSYVTCSFVNHLITICEFKLELQSGNDQFGFDPCGLDFCPLTLTFYMDFTFVNGDYP